MRVAVATIALRLPTDRTRWVTVPPQGYSGIHWVVTNLVDGLVELGHDVYLLGAPGSPVTHPRLTVVDAGEPEDIYGWLADADVDVVHDHSCGQLDPGRLRAGLPYIGTHHLTGRPVYPRNCVYLSHAQRADAGAASAPLIRISVNAARYRFSNDKDPYLLFLGRVSPFKGTYEAAAFARASGFRLVVAGPTWETDYQSRILEDFPDVEFVGEVSGARRGELLSRATAVTVMSQSVPGLWGGTWCEPGATVVSEAAACGTPVIGTGNGCLAEIVPPVGAIVSEGADFTTTAARRVVADLPRPDQVHAEAIRRWGHLEGARAYEVLYDRVRTGDCWL